MAPGGELTITGKNFKPGTKATFTLHSKPVLLGTAVVAKDGSVSLAVKLPANVPAGKHTVVIAGTGADGKPAEVSIALTVTGGTASQPATAGAATTAASADDLASTGANGVLPILAIALLALFGGAATILVRRRRTHG